MIAKIRRSYSLSLREIGLLASAEIFLPSSVRLGETMPGPVEYTLFPGLYIRDYSKEDMELDNKR